MSVRPPVPASPPPASDFVAPDFAIRSDCGPAFSDSCNPVFRPEAPVSSNILMIRVVLVGGGLIWLKDSGFNAIYQLVPTLNGVPQPHSNSAHFLATPLPPVPDFGDPAFPAGAAPRAGRVSLRPRSIHHNLIPLLLILRHVQR